MGGLILGGVVTLALLFWFAELIHARLTHQPPSWKQRQPSPPTPLANAMWGGGIAYPAATPEQRKTARRQVAWMLPLMYLPTPLAGLVAWAAGASGSVVAVAAIGAFVLTSFLMIVVAGVIGVRRSRPARDK